MVLSDKVRRSVAVLGLGLVAGFACVPGWAASSCRKVVLSGEVNAGQSWQAQLGRGWVFRLLPIRPGPAGFSGWDLVVDRDPPAGYPDALLLATLPYNSINEREIGTTFGLRAQDAIGWNPRSFQFLTDPEGFRKAQQLYLSLAKDGQLSGAEAQSGSHELDRLLRMVRKTAAGELRIEDARLIPGIADPAPFAQAWALAAARTPHQTVAAPGRKSSPRGAMAWMRFSVTMWLPAGWMLPPEVKGRSGPCIR